MNTEKFLEHMDISHAFVYCYRSIQMPKKTSYVSHAAHHFTTLIIVEH